MNENHTSSFFRLDFALICYEPRAGQCADLRWKNLPPSRSKRGTARISLAGEVVDFWRNTKHEAKVAWKGFWMTAAQNHLDCYPGSLFMKSVTLGLRLYHAIGAKDLSGPFEPLKIGRPLRDTATVDQLDTSEERSCSFR